MSVSQAISPKATANPDSPVAEWILLDSLNAKVALKGKVNVYTLAHTWTQVREQQDAWLLQSKGKNPILTFDASEVTSLDGSGFAFLIDVEEAQKTAGGQFAVTGLDPRYEPLLKEFDPIANLFPAPIVKPKRSFVVSTGMATQNFLEDTAGLISFTGHLSADLFWSLRNPAHVRWGDFVNAAVQAGIAALPIVGLVAFLIGVILSFQSAIGMQQFGAISFVGPLVSLGIFRELGPLITAILLAGRSSAAFAAEIGTMTVNNEVDALVTGGLSPIRFLIVPRVLAGILVTPILTLFADIVSVFSSALTLIIYGVPMVNFYNGMVQVVAIEDVMSGLVKATLFGVVVSAVGCLRGMQTGTGAAAVGISATRAVVSSIVLIVLVDGIFAFISYKTGF
ncbi:ABC transporter permease [Polynucleobacter paneuropaeus]|uniref:ABC transporter permease n=1 Tax=Polynucleobacter paneuropaeus TaxID=2527775 RepID=A0AAE2YIP7_9BURK|nr:ABC transporter permease [Polynucleobacter paneuropaeus]MBT8590343.1 ABC transporter permease [Polynucleobacter paneuropaeus]MBT8595719.1 ABC transporter permease [Polynucleobacter paneuropaeus]MBT8597546.1 ABC transporter permease [Polynucleobacter paneuropaeus]